MPRVLALDTTVRDGSVALAIDGVVIEMARGDPSRTHGERLPGELLKLIARHGLTLDGIDLYGVATGPGSFTGLRVGIATIQGLAMATDRRVVPVSAFDALRYLAKPQAERDEKIAVVIDAQRHDVFATLYDARGTIGEPSVGAPDAIVEEWPRGAVLAIGDGALRYEAVLRESPGLRVRLARPPAPPLAGAIAEIATRRASAAVLPHAIVPMYVRRPDAEVARRKGLHND